LAATFAYLFLLEIVSLRLFGGAQPGTVIQSMLTTGSLGIGWVTGELRSWKDYKVVGNEFHWQKDHDAIEHEIVA
jgi:hypothetical protein